MIMTKVKRTSLSRQLNTATTNSSPKALFIPKKVPAFSMQAKSSVGGIRSIKELRSNISSKKLINIYDPFATPAQPKLRKRYRRRVNRDPKLVDSNKIDSVVDLKVNNSGSDPQ